MDVARSIQIVTEEIMIRLVRHTREVTGLPNLCLAGGVALNCVANGKILNSRLFENLWIQPAAGDAGGALGAALLAFHRSQPRTAPRHTAPTDAMQAALLGPEFSRDQIRSVLLKHEAVFEELDDDNLLAQTVDLLQQGLVVAWFQGRMEFGPRALGNRSILADPRSPAIQSELNLKVKQRESFRPFAPVVRVERMRDYFELETESPYMLLVSLVRPELRLTPPHQAIGLDRLKQPRSTIPAVTHVDYSARVQTVASHQNPRLYQLLERFEAVTGCAVLVNTSFNVRGEPIVCSPDDAYRCFVNTHMDVLVLDHFILHRSRQPRRPIERRAPLHPD